MLRATPGQRCKFFFLLLEQPTTRQNEGIAYEFTLSEYNRLPNVLYFITLRIILINQLEYCKRLFIASRKNLPKKIAKMGKTEEKTVRSCVTFDEMKLISVSLPNKPGGKCALIKLRSQLILYHGFWTKESLRQTFYVALNVNGLHYAEYSKFWKRKAPKYRDQVTSIPINHAPIFLRFRSQNRYRIKQNRQRLKILLEIN